MEIDGKTKVVGIFGHPIEHTLSPAMHNAAFRSLRLNCVYMPFNIKPDDVPAAIEGLRAMEMAGANVTVPHKESVIPFLDGLTPFAKFIGAVNTLYWDRGRLMGDNTDAPGFLAALRGAGLKRLAGANVVVLGAGGAARAVSAALLQQKVRSLTLTDVVPAKARSLAARLSELFLSGRVRVIDPGPDSLREPLEEADLLVNATPIGMHPSDPVLVPAALLPPRLFVYDVVYTRETLLLKSARRAGLKCADGLGMLLHQGMLAFERWTGRRAPRRVMEMALRRKIHGS
ncbi:MAG TPA: shikimate dehydrogenase [Elusimicrobiota bacterium]|nr:shikimate dehydrogenase [Elusimicrobiota bacterium]